MKDTNWMITACVTAALGLASAGCQESSAPPTTTPPGATNQSAASPSMKMSMVDGCPDKDATHVVTTEQPVYSSVPGQGVAPMAMIAPGTKVLSMIPGAEYSKCTVAGGKTVFIKTSALKPVGTN